MTFENPSTPKIERAIHFIKLAYPNLETANFITDPDYYSPGENDVKVEWSDFLFGGCFQVMEFSEQQGKTFHVSFYLKPKGNTFEIKYPS
jgi:hypothetical protein